jgi:hypothetical protein
MFWITLLIIHGLLAVALIGALTHQAVSVVWTHARKRSFVGRFAAVTSPAYVTAIAVLFATTFVFGAYIYTEYRFNVRPVFDEFQWNAAVGVFELKEHYIALALGLLPTYWFLWKQVPTSQHRATRVVATLIVAGAAWYGFLIGHILNNLRGIGA